MMLRSTGTVSRSLQRCVCGARLLSVSANARNCVSVDRTRVQGDGSERRYSTKTKTPARKPEKQPTPPRGLKTVASTPTADRQCCRDGSRLSSTAFGPPVFEGKLATLDWAGDGPTVPESRQKSSKRNAGDQTWMPQPGEVWLEPAADSVERAKVIEPNRDGPIQLDSDAVEMERVKGNAEEVPPPQLTHGLEQILFRPGVHVLRDQRTGVYNFDHRLEDIPWPEDVHLDRLAQFTPPSHDSRLRELAGENGCRYTGSTSSLTGVLTQIHMMLNGDKPLNLDMLSAQFANEARQMGTGSTLPASVLLSKQNGVISIDNDSSWDIGKDNNLLSDLGNIGEAWVTTEIDQFNASFVKSQSDEVPVRTPQTYSYAKVGPILMRSQIDCTHPALPRQAFDIKTRAVIAVRQDKNNHEVASEYRLRALTGLYESYEREYYDLVRSAFLKNSMQVRIGGMDGIFVAHHDTRRILGFQYVPLEDMDRAITGSTEQSDAAFRLCVATLTHILDRALDGIDLIEPVKATFEWHRNILHVFIEPTTDGKVYWHTISARSSVNDHLVAEYVDFDKAKSSKGRPRDLPPKWSVKLEFGRSDDQNRSRNALDQTRRRQSKLSWQLAPAQLDGKLTEIINEHNKLMEATEGENEDVTTDDTAAASATEDGDAAAIELDQDGQLTATIKPDEVSKYDFQVQAGVRYKFKPSPLIAKLRRLAQQGARSPSLERGAEVMEVVGGKVVRKPRLSGFSDK